MMNTKNNAITIWRIIFTYIIFIFHFDNKYHFAWDLSLGLGWYIGVEFFFIVSGYLLYMGMDKLSLKLHSGWDYFVYRYKKIYPFYLGAFVFSFIFLLIANRSMGITDVVKFLSDHFFEIFALHGIGLDDGWNHLNNTAWFISILFLSGLIIYHCLLKWKDNFCNFVAPIIIMISFSYLYRANHNIDAVTQVSGFYINQALMRGLADMCLGIFAAKTKIYISKKYNSFRLFRFIGFGCFMFVILCSMKFSYATTDFLYALILTVAVGMAFLPTESKICQNKIIQSWSSLTLCLYLLHDAFRTIIFPHFFGIPQALGTKVLLLILYLVMVTISAILFKYVISGIIKLVSGVALRLNRT